ncbi:hypothetical protein [Streptomyces flavofungini]|uniref:Uncharacterized protein n=1 Tax=Streptomyces flavofungini TaxID=68200 RepID=A0ABS0XGH6_9ACTN|nr:hypothetical protein [Streptomyces flavofungini]MBJ3812307.1 hypothetical protein [Streptomyces flavofungini]GHC88559.1 hypothetical protein GCM10010349_75920 [Streptomyces flavofungini]
MTEQEARKMLPDVRTFCETLDALRAVRKAAGQAAAEKYPQRFGDPTGTHGAAECRRQLDAFAEEMAKADVAEAKGERAAWSTLAASSDPLVKWIAENCTRYAREARQVLTALPATIGELDRLADEHDFCGAWEDYRWEAAEAGVIPHRKPQSPARRAVFELLDQEGCCHLTSDSKWRLDAALDALIQEATTGAATVGTPTEASVTA